MKFVTFTGERNLTDLTRRLFDITGPQTEDLIRRAEKELVVANPHLRDFDNVPEGMLVMVPDLPGLEPPRRWLSAPLSAQLVPQLRSALESARTALEQSAQSQINQTKEKLALAEDTDLRDIVNSVPELKEQLGNVIKDEERSLKEIESTKKARTEELARLQKELEEFMT
jgi:hypothetical protein